jgi:inosine-uridine nucleoside N-ribohydrolase
MLFLQQDWRKNVLGTLPSSQVWLLNQAERYHLGDDILYWVCADCLAAAVTVSSSIIEDSETVYAYISADGTFSRGAVFVDYNGSEGIPPNIKIVRHINVDSYKTMLLSVIGGIPPAKVE